MVLFGLGLWGQWFLSKHVQVDPYTGEVTFKTDGEKVKVRPPDKNTFEEKLSSLPLRATREQISAAFPKNAGGRTLSGGKTKIVSTPREGAAAPGGCRVLGNLQQGREEAPSPSCCGIRHRHLGQPLREDRGSGIRRRKLEVDYAWRVPRARAHRSQRSEKRLRLPEGWTLCRCGRRQRIGRSFGGV